MSFVVIHASRVDRAVAHVRVVWPALPQLERNRRLHVVVLDADERPLAGPGLADDERGLALHTELARVALRRAEALGAPARRLVERRGAARLARDAAEIAQLIGEPLAFRSEVAVELIQ